MLRSAATMAASFALSACTTTPVWALDSARRSLVFISFSMAPPAALNSAFTSAFAAERRNRPGKCR